MNAISHQRFGGICQTSNWTTIVVWPRVAWHSRDFCAFFNDVVLIRIIEPRVLLPVQNRWRELSREDQEPTSDSPPSTQPPARCPERHNGIQRGGQLEEGEDYRQDSKVPAPAPCKEQEQDGVTTQSVNWSWSADKSLPDREPFSHLPPFFYAAKDAEKTASPNQAQQRRPKASPGRMTLRRRGKGGSIFWMKKYTQSIELLFFYLPGWFVENTVTVPPIHYMLLFSSISTDCKNHY